MAGERRRWLWAGICGAAVAIALGGAVVAAAPWSRGTAHLSAVDPSTTPSTLPPLTSLDAAVPVAATQAAAPTTSEPVVAHFTTVAVGQPLPSGADCAALVRRDGVEVRAANDTYDHTEGHPTAAPPDYPLYARVTGDFTGTTDEIIQWVACKWGIDEDVVRAQAATESYWFQEAAGDFTSDPALCAPEHGIGVDGRPGECPESIGILQVRTQYFQDQIVDAQASTAYNLDLAYAVWRTCFEGGEGWLNLADHGKPYVAGDLWGCVGRWFSGRWYTEPAKDYIAAVQSYLEDRVWESGDFQEAER